MFASVFTVAEKSHFDNSSAFCLVHFDSDHDSDQLYLCCAKNKIRVFRLSCNDAVDLFKICILMIRIKMHVKLQMLLKTNVKVR